MIYCVEDERNIRELLVYTLETTGFEAEGFETGAELDTAMKKNLPELILLDIYPAREEPIPGVTSSIIFDRVTIPAKRLCTKAELPGIIEAGAYDVVLMVGAGDIDRLVEPVKQILEKR